ncbi:M24 family metallopeptidase [Hazenella coriacea]|uniref:Xaa-Pro aminopeptidase n=1 Tax=Hazenella coriacea TaxID=1179467 RepID=A0A4R3LDM7_9BACL|nr:Xaa-Pro peptidase family protein [Hazenella coriacea]TCS96404.1 Xaa-Pro aminopeptidase [Hazenella coriacea]
MQKRIEALRGEMNKSNMEAILISHPINRRYITGFTGSAGLALITQNEALLITDFRYVTQVQEQVPHMTLVKHEGPILETVAQSAQQLGIQTLSFEQDHLTFAQHHELQEALGKIATAPVSGVIENLRMFKDEEELSLIRKACQIADQTFERIIQEIKPGMRELDVALRLEFIMRDLGASSSSFDIIVASGKRGALPHGTASEKVLEKGDLVTMDFGAWYQGYASDITRTIILGQPSEKQKEIYDIVLEAGKRSIAVIRPGITGIEADAAARDYITEHGYGEYFGHSTGHGLGLEVHELPRLSVKGEEELKPGMVVTVEPGIYLSELGGVRIEDDVVVTEDGCEVLTHCTKDLIIID